MNRKFGANRDVHDVRDRMYRGPAPPSSFRHRLTFGELRGGWTVEMIL